MKKKNLKNAYPWIFLSIGIIFCITGMISGQKTVVVGGVIASFVAVVIRNQHEILEKQDMILEKHNLRENE